eukprot:GEMP01010102.1.p1 GENE.GEMP01010102.1~~GEMP01010102.1.p1  ORF type:complete len:417 (+),score=84.97 GEMP01010102.1:83-1333(+)
MSATIQGDAQSLRSDYPIVSVNQYDGKKVKVAVCGGGGFIGSHLALDLKKKGFYVIAADWKNNEFMEYGEFCDEFHLADLRKAENCIKVTRGCRDVYNLAADMGGMGFIKSNEAVLMYNNTMISFHVTEAARANECKRLFYASSACVYNESTQLDPKNPGLKESDAWPAAPQDTYGLEKLYAEELGLIYDRDFGLRFRCARFHNVYGPRGTWTGGREKAPAAFIRKALVSDKEFEMWGDGIQTRSFMYINDCVEGIQHIMESDCTKPVNLGSEEMISMNDFAALALSFENKTIPIKHIRGPEGVRGRNSDNTMIRREVGWEPTICLKDGMKKTYFWIKEQVDQARATGLNVASLASSTIVTQTTAALDALKVQEEVDVSTDESTGSVASSPISKRRKIDTASDENNLLNTMRDNTV